MQTSAFSWDINSRLLACFVVVVLASFWEELTFENPQKGVLKESINKTISYRWDPYSSEIMPSPDGGLHFRDGPRSPAHVGPCVPSYGSTLTYRGSSSFEVGSHLSVMRK